MIYPIHSLHLGILKQKVILFFFSVFFGHPSFRFSLRANLKLTCCHTLISWPQMASSLEWIFFFFIFQPRLIHCQVGKILCTILEQRFWISCILYCGSLKQSHEIQLIGWNHSLGSWLQIQNMSHDLCVCESVLQTLCFSVLSYKMWVVNQFVTSVSSIIRMSLLKHLKQIFNCKVITPSSLFLLCKCDS